MNKIILLISCFISINAFAEDAEDVAKKYMNLASEMSYNNQTMGYRSKVPEEVKLEAFEEFKEMREKLFSYHSEDFERQDFSRVFDLLNDTFNAKYKKKNKQVPIDIGGANIDGTRAFINIYIVDNKCEMILVNRDKWTLFSIKCPSYY